jgi:putative ABC transport system substrate-binding protein
VYDTRDLREFRRGLRDAGFIEGQNVAVEHRWAHRQTDQLKPLAEDLIGRQVSVIVATSGPAAQAAKAATSTIPVVFAMNGDPVRAGLVSSFQHPGGNATGVTLQAHDGGPKQLELLSELLPNVRKIAVLAYPSHRHRGVPPNLRDAANARQQDCNMVYAGTRSEFEPVLSGLAQLDAGALLITPDPLFSSYAWELGELTLRYKVPAVYQFPGFAAGGGLLSYGFTGGRLAYQAGVYVGRILKGEKPGNLPVQQHSRAELVINLKTANALGLEVPSSVPPKPTR